MSGGSITRNSTALPNNMQELHQREREKMYTQMKKFGLAEISVKSILQIGSSNEGNNSLFKFLKDSGLLSNI